MRPVVFSFPAAVTTAIATAQTLAGAGSLVIDGTLLDLPATMQGVRRVILPGIERTVSLTSAGNLSAVNITITGKDLRGATVTETRAGPNANTVFTTALFHEIDSVSTNGALGTAMSVGTGDTGATNWLETDQHADPVNLTVALAITATASVTVQDTPADVNAAAPVAAEIFNHPTLAGVTASTESNYAFPPRYVRGVMNSSSGAGAFTMTVIQAG
jgi:hypothetical protein